MLRRRGLSARWKLTLSYAGVVVVSGALLLTVVALFLLRYVPDINIDSNRFIPNRSDLTRAFIPAATVVMIFLLALGLVGGWFLAGRMLAPLRRIGYAAQLASQGSLSHRIALDGRRDEFRDLADVFDTMLERLEQHVGEQKRFAANASHELRTPLAISQTLLDVARADPDRDVDALIERLQNVNWRAISLTEALLLLARVEGGTFTHERVDLSLLAEEATEALHPLAQERGIALEAQGAVAIANGSPALLQQLVTNLIHNAIVHNLPTGGTVTVHVHPQPHALTLVIENTGDILDAQRVTTLLEPFQRGAERTRSDDHGGVGLGLAIARRIAQAHGGSLQLAPRTGGGLIATMRLPSLNAPRALRPA